MNENSECGCHPQRSKKSNFHREHGWYYNQNFSTFFPLLARENTKNNKKETKTCNNEQNE